MDTKQPAAHISKVFKTLHKYGAAHSLTSLGSLKQLENHCTQ